MNPLPSPPTAPVDAGDPASARPRRRQLVVGAGVAAGAALAAAAFRQPAAGGAPVAAAGPESTSDEGYRLTEHVRRYYESTRT